jgi:hypothetical protein
MLGLISLSKKGNSTEYGAEAWTLAYDFAMTGGRQDGPSNDNTSCLDADVADCWPCSSTSHMAHRTSMHAT